MWMALSKDVWALFRSSTMARGPISKHIRLRKKRAKPLRGLDGGVLEDGFQPHEIALYVRSPAQIDRARAATESAGVKCRILDEHVEIAPGAVSVSTMHLAKGLEFRAVGVMACDDEVIPLQMSGLKPLPTRPTLRMLTVRSGTWSCSLHTRARSSACDQHRTGLRVSGRYACPFQHLTPVEEISEQMGSVVQVHHAHHSVRNV